MTTTNRHVLPVIVVAQFLCTSLWFAGNAIIGDLAGPANTGLMAHLTSAIQFGFITGTLVFALLTIADRYSPSRVFCFSAFLAAGFNLAVTLFHSTAAEILLFRFLTGFFLAGIYPVGMKIASDHAQKGLGKSLGFLVGALVLGTAFPHALKSGAFHLPWKAVLYTTTALALVGGAAILLFVPDGPYRKGAQPWRAGAFLEGFRHPDFRSAAFGYFGHMWELYTFWASVPLILRFWAHGRAAGLSIPGWSFLIIASGSLACVASGLLSLRYGAKRIATIALFGSGVCCLLSPWMLQVERAAVLIGFLFVWGMTVIADSPLFSTLVARHAPEQARGTALTIVNCIGFAITIVSIQFLNAIANRVDTRYLYLFLAIGPLFGLIALLGRREPNG